ncbi:hypothetical protein K435DRAFT_798205 [Dendrothele bispora CBS 962.96]|uniref:Uncharacterized protein n=1 Tax=Dendrothele bispora (strain CBS 962.96) TaxID=1314807 RepID=A0A4S8LZX3_DENBC|nr:hypothetical protein K435DRAFT_798205 [Dendrothele bispora CBS 962.96]
MEGGSGTGSLAADNLEELINGPPNDNAPPVEAIHDTLQLDKHVDEAETTHVTELGREDRDDPEAPPPTTSRPVYTKLSIWTKGRLMQEMWWRLGSWEWTHQGTTDRFWEMVMRWRERVDVKTNKWGVKPRMPERKEQTEEGLDTGEVVDVEQSQKSYKQGDRLSGVPCELFEDAESLVLGLIYVMELTMQENQSKHKVLFDHLQVAYGDLLIVFDNFETPWNHADSRIGVKNLLEKIAKCGKVSLIVTMRGLNGPGDIPWEKLGDDTGCNNL